MITRREKLELLEKSLYMSSKLSESGLLEKVEVILKILSKIDLKQLMKLLEALYDALDAAPKKVSTFGIVRMMNVPEVCIGLATLLNILKQLGRIRKAEVTAES